MEESITCQGCISLTILYKKIQIFRIQNLKYEWHTGFGDS